MCHLCMDTADNSRLPADRQMTLRRSRTSYSHFTMEMRPLQKVQVVRHENQQYNIVTFSYNERDSCSLSKCKPDAKGTGAVEFDMSSKVTNWDSSPKKIIISQSYVENILCLTWCWTHKCFIHTMTVNGIQSMLFWTPLTFFHYMVKNKKCFPCLEHHESE